MNSLKSLSLIFSGNQYWSVLIVLRLLSYAQGQCSRHECLECGNSIDCHKRPAAAKSVKYLDGGYGWLCTQSL